MESVFNKPLDEEVKDLNGNLESYREWKSLTSTTGQTQMTLPDQTQAKEFVFIARYGTSSGPQQLSFSFPVPNLTGISLAFTQGYQLDNGNGFCQINVNCDTHKANLIALRISGVDYTATSTLFCYYR